MSPAPDVNHETTTILSSTLDTTLVNNISLFDNSNQNMIKEQIIHVDSSTVNSMESINLSEDDDAPTVTEDNIPQLTICPSSSTSTGEHDPPVIFRKPSILAINTITTSNTYNLPQIEGKYQDIQTTINTNSDDNNGFFYKFFGCFKPFISVMHQFGENIKYHKKTPNTLIKSNDDWEISIDNIVNLKFIGGGIEGSVFHGKLNGQDIACKRVKSKEETNIKHLKKLNHINVIKFRGISISPPLYYIIMEYCANGSLYDKLKQYREIDFCTKATQVLNWSRQISNGVDYLHSNKIVHRDLKSPNILFFDKNILKISDFGISKELINRRSLIMSFNGTSAWMAPEVIKKELCSEKIDVWSFGIILWEMVTCAVPYNNIDPIAVMWGVAKGTLKLPIPSSIPECFKSLMTMCWNQQPSNRPSFQQIIKHLDIKKSEIILFEQEQEYAELTRLCSNEINENLLKFSTIDISSILQLTNDELIEKRQEELQYINDLRQRYELRTQQINRLYIELKTLMIQLEQREQIIKEKENLLNINKKKRTINAITQARKKSLEIIKAATRNLNDPINLLSQKRRYLKKDNKQSSNIQLSANLHNTSNQLINKQDLTNIKNLSRRKKISGHHHNNSKENATPSNHSTTESQKERYTAISTIQLTDEKLNLSSRTTINSPLPSISAVVDAKSKTNNYELNRKNLKLDLKNPVNELIFSSNKCSKYRDETHYHTFPRQRRRRYINSDNNKTKYSSSMSSLSTKSNLSNEQHSHSVKFHLSPLIINDQSSQRKIIKHMSYTSSEEGEVEDIHSDNYILDDKKHRDKHNCSSESEIYGEKNNHSLLKNDGIFSDEGGHVSDERPDSRESMFNSEPEHE
ncbi:unnamed protein product [Rotaria sp. Silwood1]|nr:unnamed protein product [Rotaria sp. Silwood1]